MRKTYFKIIAPTLLAILLFMLTLFFIVIPHFKDNMLDGKKEMIKELTNSACSILAKYESDERAGLLSQKQAQEIAISRIEYLRYGEDNKDYFWITDMHPNMVMHPYRHDLVGSDLSSFTDSHGKKMFVEFVNVVKKNEHGFVDYMWQWKDDSNKIVPKLSYVKIFKPWNWVIGTGIYIEDVKQEIALLTRKLIWISISISLAIALLLLYIIQQSMKIEQKRQKAELELKESREKFRTLVEATTEGLLMVVNKKINYANFIICDLLGYKTDELTNIDIATFINKNNHAGIVQAFSQNPIIEGQYELLLQKKNGTFIETLVVVSNINFLGNKVNILTIKNVSTEKSFAVSNQEYQRLINILNIGFIKAKISKKGKIIYANEVALHLLGFQNFREIQDVHIIELIKEKSERLDMVKTLLKEGFVKKKNIQVIKKNNEEVTLSATFMLVETDDDNGLICDGMIEDITLQQYEKDKIYNLIAQLKGQTFLLEQAVLPYIYPPLQIHMDKPIQDAVNVFLNKDVKAVLIVNNNSEIVGIITKSDILERILNFKLQLDNPCYLIMSAPVVYIPETENVNKALITCEKYNIHNLVVRNENNAVTGIFNYFNVAEKFKNSMQYYIKSIENAGNINDLKKLNEQFKLFLLPIIKSNIDIEHITAINTAFSDALSEKVVRFAIEELGAPPIDFAFVCMGSEGRKEESLFTDQDNAIIYANCTKDQELFIRPYFLKMGDFISNALYEIGYEYCKGNIMAKNPQWCLSLEQWVKLFKNWITAPEPQHLLDAMIFFDMRHLIGNTELVNSLKNIINETIQSNFTHLYLMAQNAATVKFSTSTPIDKNNDFLDIKTLIMPIVMIARTYALKANIDITNTLDRIKAIKNLQLLNAGISDEMIECFNILMKWRIKYQAFQIENNISPSNQININYFSGLELIVLKKMQAQLQEFQKKMAIDFRIN